MGPWDGRREGTVDTVEGGLDWRWGSPGRRRPADAAAKSRRHGVRHGVRHARPSEATEYQALALPSQAGSIRVVERTTAP